MRVVQSCEMVSTCTELTYVLGLAGGGYVESVVCGHDQLLFISCQDSSEVRKIGYGRVQVGQGDLQAVNVVLWILKDQKEAEVGGEGIPHVGVGNREFDPLPTGNGAGNGESFRRLKV